MKTRSLPTVNRRARYSSKCPGCSERIKRGQLGGYCIRTGKFICHMCNRKQFTPSGLITIVEDRKNGIL